MNFRFGIKTWKIILNILLVYLMLYISFEIIGCFGCFGCLFVISKSQLKNYFYPLKIPSGFGNFQGISWIPIEILRCYR